MEWTDLALRKEGVQVGVGRLLGDEGPHDCGLLLKAPDRVVLRRTAGRLNRHRQRIQLV